MSRAPGTAFGRALAEPGAIERVELRSPFGFMAFHGGALERQTDRIAAAAADASGASLYVVAHPGPDPPHFPSTSVRAEVSPALEAFLGHVRVVVTVHGYGRDGMFTTLLLGGSNRELASSLRAELTPALPDYDIVDDLDAIPRELRGLHPDNPVNVPQHGGVQLELPPRCPWLGPRWADWTGDGFVPPAAALVDALAAAARTWVAVELSVAPRRPAAVPTSTRLAALVVLAMASWSCAGDDDDDILSPLPIEGATVATVAPVSSPGTVAATSTTPGGLPLPTADSTSRSTTAPLVSAPVGDWDGARFDAGTIDSVGTVEAYTSIELDRWSYTRPDGTTVDGAGLTAEPLVVWWRESPFGNVRGQTRTFILSPDVEVLELDPTGRAAVCNGPPAAEPPAPAWLERRTADLDPTAEGTIAVLTYSPTGQVTRIRLTRGC